MRHLDEGTIHAWLDGALNEEKAHQAEEHAARCTQCAIAVADARGFIAASSRILLGLDDVPRGVVPKRTGYGSGYGSGNGSARGSADGSATAATRRYRPWMFKVAASIVVVATTGVLLVRTGTWVQGTAMVAARKTESFDAASGGAASGAGAPSPIAAAATPAPTAADSKMPAANAPASELDRRAEGLLKAKAAESGMVASVAVKPAAEPTVAPAPAAPASAARVLAVVPTESPRVDSTAPSVANQVASVAPKLAVSASGTGGAAKRSIGVQDAALPPGMRMVSEQTLTAKARVVQKRVYEVSPGVEVTYSIFEPVPARQKAAESAASANDSAGEGKDETADSDVGVNTIKWSDSTGTDFMLSGRIPLDSLRMIRSRLTTVNRR